MLKGRILQLISSSTPVLPAKRKSTPMNTNWFFAFNLFVYNHCIFRIEMLGFKELPGFISSDRYDAEVKSSKNLS
jgi:hypothetical protein